MTPCTSKKIAARYYILVQIIINENELTTLMEVPSVVIAPDLWNGCALGLDQLGM